MGRGNIDREKYMSRDEAAKYLGIAYYKVKPLIDQGKLKGKQRGRDWYVDRASAKELKDGGFW